MVLLAGAAVGALGVIADAVDQHLVARIALGLLSAYALHLLLALPNGRVARRRWMSLVATGYGSSVDKLGALTFGNAHLRYAGSRVPSCTFPVTSSPCRSISGAVL